MDMKSKLMGKVMKKMSNKPKTRVDEAMMEAPTGRTKKVPSAKAMGSMGMKAGGLAAGHKTADGVAHKGKTKGTKVVMAGVKSMKKGGYC